MDLYAPSLMTPEGWIDDCLMTIGEDGTIMSIEAVDTPPPGAHRAAGPVLPGMPNLHSHAFQRAMAGLTEHWGSPTDSFWTWRYLMYRFVERLNPDHIGAIARQLYVESLKGGYTAVAEFHYLHNAPDGRRYDDPAETSHQILSAALDTGIALTHLPVLYAYGGFGDVPLGDAQKRFRTDPDMVLQVGETVLTHARSEPSITVGAAAHSLRAAPPALIKELLAGLHTRDPNAPIHIHIAEQVKEVEDCLFWSGKRPVALLSEEVDLNATWCLVHATHLEDEENAIIAGSGAVAGLCPTTEANLGDGLFPFPQYLGRDGAYGIGSDSHVCRDAAEELRLLEYGQRLFRQARNITADEANPATGAALWRASAIGGARACGMPAGALEVGKRADLIVLDGSHHDLTARSGDTVVDTLVFGGAKDLIRDVMVAGRWVVTEGRHPQEDAIAATYRQVLQTILD